MREHDLTPRDPHAPAYSVSGPDRIDHKPVDRPFSSNDPIRQPWATSTVPEEPRAGTQAPELPRLSRYAGDPHVGEFTNFLRAAGAGDIVAEAMAWFDDADGQHHDDFAARDARDRAEVRAELTALWGADKFDSNIGKINAFLNAGNLPDHVADLLHDARMRSGRAVLNHAPTLQKLLGYAQANPLLLPKVSGDIDAQIRAIEEAMRKDRAAYNRDEAMQRKYRALLTAKHGG